MAQVDGVFSDLLRMAAKSPAAPQHRAPRMIPLRHGGQTVIGAKAVRHQDQIMYLLHGKDGESGLGRRTVGSRYTLPIHGELEAVEGTAQRFANHLARSQVRSKMRTRRLARGQAARPCPVEYD